MNLEASEMIIIITTNIIIFVCILMLETMFGFFLSYTKLPYFGCGANTSSFQVALRHMYHTKSFYIALFLNYLVPIPLI